MARPLTSDELALLRSDTQWSKLYLAILKPNTIYTARLSALPTSTDRVYEITFTSGSGTLSDVKMNMTLWVGSTAGAHDLGIARIRKAPIAGTFYIGLTSEIRWQSSCYLTVVDEFDLWAKHATTAASVLSMDVDIAYSDQHTKFSPVPIMGSHAVLWLDGATVSVDFDASDSWVFDSSISSYAWSAPGSSAASGMSSATPHITYNSVGSYRVYLTVTGANGKSTTGVRYVFVYDHADNPPATVFQLAQCVGDTDTGGWMFDLSMEAEATLSDIHDRTLVVLFAEDWYGSPATRQSIGPLAGRENIVCVGKIVGESIRSDREGGLVHFTVQGLHHWLNKIKAFPIELEWISSTAGGWGNMLYMTMDKVLHDILYWHSTAIETMDFYPSESALYMPDGKTIASTIWGQLTDIAVTRLLAEPGVNRLGQLCIEIDPQMVPEDARSSIPTVMTVMAQDYQEGFEFARMTVPDCSEITLSSHQVNVAGSVATLYSLSPGHIPLRYGEPEVTDRLLSSDQADSNQKAGLLLGWRINPYPDIPINLAMNNRMFDLFPRQYAELTLSAADSPRGDAFTLKLIPRHMAIYFEGDSGFIHSELNFEGANEEQLSVTGDVPESESVDISSPSVPSFPTLPTLPDLGGLGGFPGTTPTTDGGPPEVAVILAGVGIAYTKNFNTASPTWILINAGLSGFETVTNKLFVTPNGAMYAANVVYNDNTAFIARAPNPGGTFSILERVSYYSVGSMKINMIGFNPLVPEDVCYQCDPHTSPTQIFKHGAGSTFTTIPGFLPWSDWGDVISFGNGKFLAIAGEHIPYTWGPDYTGVTSHPSSPAREHIRIGTTSNFLLGDYNISGLYLGQNLGTTYSALVNVASDLVVLPWSNKIACDPTGNYIIQAGGTGSGITPTISVDGGYHYSVIAGLPVSNWRFAYAGNDDHGSRWIAGAGGGYLYYGDHAGSSWTDKLGNLPSLAPSGINISGICVVKQ